jgi:hypothetical protein
LPAMPAHESLNGFSAPNSLRVLAMWHNIGSDEPVRVSKIHRSTRSTFPVQRNLRFETDLSKCSFQSALRGPSAFSISWFTQAFTFGFALASISALGRRKRIVMVFDVTQRMYHISRKAASLFKLTCAPAPLALRCRPRTFEQIPR